MSNMTFDGQHAYTYDAWNRLVKVHRAYRDQRMNSGDIYEQACVKSVTGRQRGFSKHLFGIIRRGRVGLSGVP